MLIAAFVAGFLIFTGAGALLWQKGLRAREGFAPHCGYCGSDLSGGPLSECQVCHRPLPEEMIQVGRASPRVGMVRAGRLLFVLGVVLLLATLVEGYRLSRGQWYCFRPTFLVIANLRGPLAELAADELGIRCRIGMLSTTQIGRAADRLLDLCEEGAHLSRYQIDLLGTLWTSGELEEEYSVRLFACMDRVEPVLAGPAEPDGLLVRLTGRVRAPGGWVPLRRIELLEGTEPSALLFCDYHWPGYDAATTRPTEIPVTQPVAAPVRIRFITVWRDFRADLLGEDLYQTAGEARDRILRDLAHRQWRPIIAYQQDFELVSPDAAPTGRTERRVLPPALAARYLPAPPELPPG